MNLEPPQPARASTDIAPPEDWVPLDRRWLGLDRATLPHALVALGLAVLMAVVLPWLDAATANPNTVRSGDVLRFASGVTTQPPTGWVIESGTLSTERTSAWASHARLSSGGTVVDLKVAPYTGDNATLLASLQSQTDALNSSAGFHVVGAPVQFTTHQAVTGLLSRFESPGAVGVLAVAVWGGIGVKIAATGAQTLGRDAITDVAGVLDSLTFAEGK
jgi:hypothetical protein